MVAHPQRQIQREAYHSFCWRRRVSADNAQRGKRWRFIYCFIGKSRLLSLGAYPAVKLKDARIKREELRQHIASSIDPGQLRKAEKVARQGDTNSFETIAREWFEKFRPTWVAFHADKIIRQLERDVFPYLGNRAINRFTTSELLTVLRRI